MAQVKKDRRERHRLRVRERYYQSLVDANECCALLKQLTTQRCALLSQIAATPDANTSSRALQQYVEAITLADRLRDEKQALRELIDQREILQQKLLHILGDWDSFVSVRAHFCILYGLELTSVCKPNAIVNTTSSSLKLRPLTVQDCRELTSAYYSDIQRSMRSRALTTSQRSVFGWSDASQVNGQNISFFLQKDIAGHTPLDLSSRSWQLISSPTGYARMCSPVLTSTMERLQVVDEHNVVMYERLSRPDASGSCHSLFLASRLQTDYGFVEIFQPLDASRVQWRGDAEISGVWVDTDFWCVDLFLVNVYVKY